MSISQRVRVWMMMCLTLLVSWTVTGATPAAGPLRISTVNPRYFTDGSGKVVYLTGSHTWDNLQDWVRANHRPSSTSTLTLIS